MQRSDLTDLPTPCYVLDQAVLRHNLQIIDRIRSASGAKVLLALKAFALWRLFPMLSETLDGVTASSLNEGRLGREQFAKQVHLYAPAYRDDDFEQIIQFVDHVTFNSFSQWRRFQDRVGYADCAMRVNPQHSEVEQSIYDPCATYSRFGVTAEQFDHQPFDGLNGLHFHNLCESNADALERTLDAFDARFGKYLDRCRWLNFGGGHIITREDYNCDLLIELIARYRQRYGVEVFLEPGMAIVLNAGVFIATVLDIVHNQIDIALLDTSAAAHMPDILEMSYRPEVQGAAEPGEKSHTYRLGGITCFTGDVIGDYSFDQPLRVGDQLVFEDMAHYTMVKNNMFNGVNLPAIALIDSDTNDKQVIRQFGYEDYKTRLA